MLPSRTKVIPQVCACSTTSCWSSARTGRREQAIRNLRYSTTSSRAVVGPWVPSSPQPASPETRVHALQPMRSWAGHCSRVAKSSSSHVERSRVSVTLTISYCC